jgi:hypothetical protein
MVEREVAKRQRLAQLFKGRCQAAASTGKASSNLNGATIYGCFLWGLNRSYSSSTEKDQEDDQTALAVKQLSRTYTRTQRFSFSMKLTLLVPTFSVELTRRCSCSFVRETSRENPFRSHSAAKQSYSWATGHSFVQLALQPYMTNMF